MPRKKQAAVQKNGFGFAAFAAALMSGNESAALSAAAAFVVAELIFAGWAKLPLLPFVLCAGGFIALILVAASRPEAFWVMRSRKNAKGINETGAIAARFLALLLMTKFISVVVAVTGGTSSPFAAILFVPVFVGALYFGVAGSAATGTAIFALFVILSAWQATGLSSHKGSALQGMVFLCVSLFAGLLVRRLEQTAQTAQIRAKQQADRAARFEWLSDTSVMMESLLDLEPMLAAGLLRVDELVPSNTVAVFLREPDGPDFLLAQTLGISDDHVGLRRIALADQEILQNDPSSILWTFSDNETHDRAGVFGQLDEEAQSVLIVPLRTYGDLFGVLYLGRHGSAKPFTRRECDDLAQMAMHIVYPIQRVRLQALALTDALTGLSNIRAFRRRMQTEVERATRYRHSLSLLMFDIDHFKRVNDTLGHRAGDALLTQMGGILHRACRGIDMAARYGGEELVILCPETSEAEAVRVAERVRVAVAEHLFVLPNGGDTRLTISAGVAALPFDAGDAPSLVEAADGALYAAKQSGRNRVCTAREAAKPKKGLAAEKTAVKR